MKRFFLLLRRGRCQGGQSLVEMALVLPFLLTIILGTVEFGYYIYTYSELENATRRASEFASKTPPRSQTNPNDANDKCVQLAIADGKSNVFLSNKTNVTIAFAFPDNARQVGKRVQVSTSYPITFLTPVGQNLFGSTRTFQFTSQRTITSIDPPFGYKADCSPN